MASRPAMLLLLSMLLYCVDAVSLTACTALSLQPSYVIGLTGSSASYLLETNIGGDVASSGYIASDTVTSLSLTNYDVSPPTTCTYSSTDTVSVVQQAVEIEANLESSPHVVQLSYYGCKANGEFLAQDITFSKSSGASSC